MKLERLDEYLTTATAVVIGVGVAYWLGLLAGGGHVGTIVALFGGVIFAVLLLAFRENVWMLIPATWPLAGQLPQVKFNPALHDVVILGVAAATFMLIAFKIVRRRNQLQAVDFWVWVNLLYLATVYIRNPAGGLVLNSERIGGRAYLNTAFCLAAFWVLARAALPNGRHAAFLLFTTIGLRISQGFLSVFTNMFPSVVPYIIPYYTGVDATAFNSELQVDTGQESTGRRGYLMDIGEPIVRYMICRFRPLDLVNPLLALVSPFKYLRAKLFFTGLLLCLLTGFRSGIVSLVAFLLIVTLLQEGWRAYFRLKLFFAVGVFAIIVVQSTIMPLPLAAQRALSFLPGRWNSVAVEEARASSDWRFYMWERMLESDKYITNKWFGDGFGFSFRQFQLIQSAQARGGEGEFQEAFMLIGQVHSGPISAVRYVGYVGYILYVFLIITLALEAWSLCKRAHGTPYQTLTFFTCLPIIWEPINFTYIFGSFDYAFPTTLFTAGMVKMLRNTLDAHVPEEAPSDEAPAPLQPQRRYQRPIRRPALAPAYLPKPAAAAE